MDPKAIKELEILHEVSQNEHINQRHLSKKLGMAAGLVNLYLKRLAHKGYIKVSGIKPRRLKYLVTPKGIAEKTRLTYEFALISYKYFKTVSDDIRKELQNLEEAGYANVVVFGTGELAELCLLIIAELDLDVVAVVEDKPEAGRFQGYPVVPVEMLSNLIFDKVIVAEMEDREKVENLLDKLGIDRKKVFWPLRIEEQ